MLGRPEVSVVVISYNDAGRVGRAVRSLYGQSLRNLEIIVVDDASTDETERVVRRLPGVRYVRREQNSGGCGAPRNDGIDAARAPFIMFLDSDDELPRHACKSLLTEIERTGSDFVAGQISRLYESSGKTKPYYPELFSPRRVVDGIRAEPKLFLDGFSTNKLYRVDFLRRHQLRFREDLHYEDHVFTADLYAAAERFAIVPWVVYHWHRVPGRGVSISLNLREVNNARQRVAAAEAADEILRRNGLADLVPDRQVRFVKQDLRVYLNALPYHDASWAQELAAVAGPYLERLAPGVLAKADPMVRVCCTLIQQGRIDELAVAARSLTGPKAPPREVLVEGGRTYWGDRKDPALDITNLGLAGLPFTATRIRHEVTDISINAATLAMEITTYDPFQVIKPDYHATMKIDHHEVRLTPKPQPNATYLTTLTLDLAKFQDLGGFHEPRIAFTRQDGKTTSDRVLISPTTHPIPVNLRGRRITIGPHSAAGVLRLTWLRTDMVHTIARTPWLKPHARKLRALPTKARHHLGSRRIKLSVYKQLIKFVPQRKDLVLFEADAGKGYTGHPRYIHEELLKRGLGLTAVWSRAKGKFPTDVATVRRMSWRHVWTMARAGWWVDSHGMPLGFPKPTGTRYLQTWHGQGIKTVGLNAPDLRGDFPGPREEWRANVARWDALVSPSAEFERTFVPSNEYAGLVLRFGSPRCDVLVKGDPAARARVRDHLEIPPDKKILLYAPTYRDQNKMSGKSVRINLSELATHLSHEWVLILRTHPVDTYQVPERLRGFVRPAGAYPEINDLLLAADVLVTDYSSLMCDFALTGKPMVFYIDDWEEYRRAERGVTYDFPAIAPGPCVTTTADLLTALREPYHLERYAAFLTTWCADERGDAAARIVSAFFEGRPLTVREKARR
ncbi:CDP-glycerol glycerophosphotransferase family protein [Acrocarpospora sp. B8E8]|uniref:bifunctional glycosyltransferase/CDP-glycerol:glycerophosphate glycerophosphotransferase n=1 Tax=Acrocarpospora sp. B8E8 TaxID=3153572 RepID=UPI00325D520E